MSGSSGPEVNAPNLYSRWSRGRSRTSADILGPAVRIEYDTDAGRVHVAVGEGAAPVNADPDTARMIGVRLIEAATRAEGDRRVRDAR